MMKIKKNIYYLQKTGLYYFIYIKQICILINLFYKRASKTSKINPIPAPVP